MFLLNHLSFFIQLVNHNLLSLVSRAHKFLLHFLFILKKLFLSIELFLISELLSLQFKFLDLFKLINLSLHFLFNPFNFGFINNFLDNLLYYRLLRGHLLFELLKLI